MKQDVMLKVGELLLEFDLQERLQGLSAISVCGSGCGRRGVKIAVPERMLYNTAVYVCGINAFEKPSRVHI
jgi:hypothetical protein